jgi:hypothetical protein
MPTHMETEGARIFHTAPICPVCSYLSVLEADSEYYLFIRYYYLVYTCIFYLHRKIELNIYTFKNNWIIIGISEGGSF